ATIPWLPTPFEWPLKGFATSLMKRIEKNKKVTGPFCSELVGRFYARLGLPLFDDQRPPHMITPNDLANSKLDEEKNIVVDFDQIREPLVPIQYDNLESFFSALEQKAREQQEALEAARDLTDTIKTTIAGMGTVQSRAA